jgi:hypothetical protein
MIAITTRSSTSVNATCRTCAARRPASGKDKNGAMEITSASDAYHQFNPGQQFAKATHFIASL